MSELNNLGKGVGLCALTGLVLIILRLTDVISWGWVWVLIPFWGPVALIMLALIMVTILAAVAKFAGWAVKKL